MGSRIAQIPALAGYTQQFRTSATDRLEHAAAQLRERMDKLVKSGKMNAELAERAHDQLDFSTDLDSVAPYADIVIEAATE